MPKSNDWTSLEAYLKHSALKMHANYILVPQTQIYPVTHPLHSLQQFDLLTFNVFLTRASNDLCPWE